MSGGLGEVLVAVDRIVVAGREGEIAYRRAADLIGSGVGRLPADPAPQVVGDPRVHHASTHATASTAISVLAGNSRSQITPVAAGYGNENNSRRTSAVLR